ncbi:MAG: prepilin-type N-terminal cleavage/methylation domain-containing protein [Candidatus Pacebacteria bacterium]|nr:prepilin-type N-terminal cleavage/methylation domain-containing protein [Candidatus Paceibacterota bacterium]
MKYKKGFTIIEMIVAVTVFSILFISVTGVFISILRAQRQAFTVNYLTDQASYSLEYLYRQIRDAQELIVGEDNIQIKDKNGVNVIIELKDQRISFGDSFLTPKDIIVGKLSVLKEPELDSLYKKITILLEMSKDSHSLILQQTISLRNPS